MRGTRATLRVAILEALNRYGIDVLGDSRLMADCIYSGGDPMNPYVVAFLANCTPGILDGFARAAHAPSTESLAEAMRSMQAALCRECGLQSEVAQKVASEVAFAVATYLGVTLPQRIIRVAISDDGHITSSAIGASRGSNDELADVDKGRRLNRGARFLPSGNRTSRVSRSRLGAVVLVCGAVTIIVFVAMALTNKFVPSSEPKIAVTSAKEEDFSTFVGTWYPEGIECKEGVGEYDKKMALDQQGELSIDADGSFSRVFFPDVLYGSWAEVDGGLELRPESSGSHFQWSDESDVSLRKGAIENGNLVVSYAGGTRVTYSRDSTEVSGNSFVGLWEIRSWVIDNKERYGPEVFEEYRKEGLYAIYLELKSDGTAIWDNQSNKREGRWKAISQTEAFCFFESTETDGDYWQGVMELEDDELVFHYHGEGTYESFVRLDGDPRANLSVKE